MEGSVKAANADGKPKLVAVLGPTATGKSALALHLARRFGGEVVGADSMQVYKGLTVGTAALTGEEAGGIPQHLVGFLPPEEPFSVAAYVGHADEAIRAVAARGRLPILCGGTGLYVQSLVCGLRFEEGEPDAARSAALEAMWEAEGGEALLLRLAARDPAHAQKLHPADKTRIVRALLLWEQTGQTRAAREQAAQNAVPPYHALCLGLDYQDRQVLYARIEQRVDEMMRRGLLAEAETVWQHRQQYRTAAQAIGYKEFFPYFAGEAPLEACVAQLKTASRRYAKRQRTWFRRMQGIHWLTAGEAGTEAAAEALVADFL